ncbi:hypothetical protein ASF32_05845 [Methylobacterium sp. Leaf91]|nr:hypothetical protein ASF24_05530 [Methylobacterium sp. Leaf86]KQO90462.1 hypothetical protein ASF32_05845 [Methylobacterium sp. Leaf91]
MRKSGNALVADIGRQRIVGGGYFLQCRGGLNGWRLRGKIFRRGDRTLNLGRQERCEFRLVLRSRLAIAGMSWRIILRGVGYVYGGRRVDFGCPILRERLCYAGMELRHRLSGRQSI